MLYAKIVNDKVIEWPVTEKQLRLNLGNMILPETITEECLQGSDYYPIPKTSNTLKSTKTQYVVITPAKNEEVKWVASYTHRDVPLEEQEQRLAKKWVSIRALRDQFMKSFEWRVQRYDREVALGLTPHDDINELHSYMQSLADITKIDDPWSISFPNEPVEAIIN